MSNSHPTITTEVAQSNWEIPKQSDNPNRKSIRVLHLINGEHFSGAERVQDLLGMTLPKFGYQPGFVCLKDGKFPKQRESTQCPLKIEPMSSRLDFKVVRKIAGLVAGNSYDIIHAHTPRTLMVGRMVAKKTGSLLVYHVHSPVGRDSTRGLQNRLNQWIENWSLRQCDAMICVSRSLASYMFASGHPRHKLHVVTNGVCTVSEIPHRLPPCEPWTLGTTALFRPRKGMEILLQALAELARSGRKLRFVAVGPFESETYERQIKALAEELGVSPLIEWTGFQSDVNRYFQQMDIFVLPSLFGEGLPMVVLEAMANGVPVIAADVEGVAEALRHERDGLVFKPGDTTDLVRSVQRMLDHECDWNDLRQSAIQRQRESFSELSMAAGVANVYDQLVKKRYAANFK